MATTFKTITKAALLEALEMLNDDDQIAFASDYGDRCHTQQLHRLRGNIEEVSIKESGYADSGFAVADIDEADRQHEDGEALPTVYLLS